MSTNVPPDLTCAVRPGSRRTSQTVRPTPDGSVLELDGITVGFGDHRVLDALDLDVSRGELLALLGPSGSGKTTVIRTIAGFQEPDAGTVRVNGRDVSRVPVHRRGIGLVFQSYALFPHLTVAQNIAYPLTVRRVRGEASRRRVDELIDLVRLGGHAHKRPAALSGGQQQRVALARALAMDPELLLLDEPLSNLDANLRREVGEEIRRLQQRTGATAVMVTHDRQEAFGMADRIAVLQAGRIEQLGVPETIYRRPVSRFMAEFVGEANLLPGRVLGSAGLDRVLVRTSLGTFTCAGSHLLPGTDVHLLVRPESFTVLPDGASSDQHVDGVVVECLYYGSSVVATVRSGDQLLRVVASGTARDSFVVDHDVHLGVRPEDVVAIPDERS